MEKINSAETKEKLNELKVAYLGKKGELTALLKNMKNIAPEERAEFGKVVNEARETIENSLTSSLYIFSKTFESVITKSGVFLSL